MVTLIYVRGVFMLVERRDDALWDGCLLFFFLDHELWYNDVLEKRGVYYLRLGTGRGVIKKIT